MKRLAVIAGVALVFAGPVLGEVSIELKTGGAGSVVQKAPNALPNEAVADFGTPRFWSSLDSFDMHPNSSGFAAVRSSTSGLFCSSASTDSQAVGQLQVPHGVRLDLVRFWFFDSGAEDMTMSLRSACLPDFAAAIPTLSPLASITSSGTGGVGSLSSFLPTSTIADNQSCTYQVTVQFGNGTGSCSPSLGFYKGRMQWFRQIPPAPAVATFTDVPVGSQFFAEVEALVASGVTAGCTASQFCPGNALTRLQMAAFLARALGLPKNTIADPANP